MTDKDQDLGEVGRRHRATQPVEMETHSEVGADPSWIACQKRNAPEGETVLTKIDDGRGVRNVQTLVRRGNLWFTGESGNAMYVYYAPTHWKPVTCDQGITTEPKNGPASLPESESLTATHSVEGEKQDEETS